MRIISGAWRRQTLKVPPNTRPTTDRVREAIFSLLGEATDLLVLDLYAGSGALGIEALSRGARGAWFVDISRRALLVIQENLRGKEGVETRLLRQDALDYLHHAPQAFRWIFCDPPYDRVDYYQLLQAVAQSAALDQDTLFILEADCFHPFTLPERLILLDRRRFGDTIINLIKRLDPKEEASFAELARA